MKTEEEIKEAQRKLYERWNLEVKKVAVSEVDCRSGRQLDCMSGMIAVMAWLFDSKNNTIFQRTINGERFS